MVKSRKFLVEFFNCFFVFLNCSFFFLEKADVYSLASVTNRDLPKMVSLVPCDPRYSRSVGGKNFVILGILRCCALAKIGTAVVKSVAVNMVNDFAWTRTYDQSVHPDGNPFFLPNNHAGSVKVVLGNASSKTPVPFHQPVVVVGIDNGNFSSCERNKFDRLVERLNNRFALDAKLGHDLTPNEIAVFNRFSIVPSFAGGW